MNNILSKYNVAKDQLREYLVQYLESQGRHIVTGKVFTCLNPEHEDSTPSCGIVPDSHGRYFHCFGCGCTGDIFTAASFLEGRQLSGASFVHDNLKYLADIFGVEVPVEEPNPEQQYEMDTYRAYRDAAQILLVSKFSDRVAAKLIDYGWSKEVRTQLGVGSVTSYEDFVSRMKKQHGWSDPFLKEIDLHRRSMFNENNLIFTVKDENANPVGFACRNLLYEEEAKQYESAKAHVLATTEEGSDLRKVGLAGLKHPSKYINSMEYSGEETAIRNRIYQKSKRLFGLHRARKYTPPLYVFEGYSDCVTAVNSGLQNSCSIGSTSFTRDHLELILGLGIKHIIFVLDADDAGEAGTDRFVKLLEECVGGNIGLRVEIIAMPEGTDDPDNYIRKMGGLKAFRALEKIDIFGWSLRKAIKIGEDPTALAERMVPLIVNDQSNFVRLRKAEQLSKATGIFQDVVWREVTRLVDSEISQINEEKTLIAQQAAKQLQLKPLDVETILATTIDKIEKVQARKAGYSVANTMRYLDEIKTIQEQDHHVVELSTGWPLFDKWVGGIPRGECFVTIPGKMNQGKSSLLANLAWRLIECNKNECMVLYHTIDDAMSIFLPRVWASMLQNDESFDSDAYSDGLHKTGWYSNDFKKAGYALNAYQNFGVVYQKAIAWTTDKVERELFVPEDISTLAPSLPALENRIKAIRQKYPERKLVVIGDNFHLYDFPGFQDGEAKTRHMSMFVKGLANKYHATMIMTMELPKTSLQPGVRPRVRNIKGTGGISYDSSLNIGVYNDIKDFGEAAKLIDLDHNHMDPSTNCQPYHRPIIELVFDKSKINSFDGTIYFQFEPRSGRFDECPLETQEGQLGQKDCHKLAMEYKTQVVAEAAAAPGGSTTKTGSDPF
jgi:DNA primase/KaiC/GvpD/RAD55 family RecA-like ATPase